MKVIIIGAGLGGLACAVACRQHQLDVIVIERTSELSPLGAGIQVPPNGARILRELGLLDKLKESSIVLDTIDLRRYANGELLLSRPVGEDKTGFEAPWMVCHRADYQQNLYDKALDLGVQVMLGCEVSDIDFSTDTVMLKNGDTIQGDVIVGADGLWSTARGRMLDHPYPPVETGDLAYRGIFSLQTLMALKNPRIEELCSKNTVTVWFGPGKHAVFYPVKGKSEFNLVLLRPDNLPEGVRTQEGDISEMRASFEGWDDVLTEIISCIPAVLKWKLCHFEELNTWTKGAFVLLGDACHPTLPYQAQGAAMAVEDGAVLGKLLGLLKLKSGSKSPTKTEVSGVLKLFESLRKSRTTTNVLGAVQNRTMYHLPDGPEQEKRDEALKRQDWYRAGSGWGFTDPEYNNNMLGFDVIQNCVERFRTEFAC